VIESGPLQGGRDPRANFRLTRFHNLAVLESGSYWPQLQPYFVKPYFKRLIYRLASRGETTKSRNEVLSTRGASGLGELDVAYVRDRLATTMLISDPGLPDYCLTSVSQGALTYLGPASRLPAAADSTIGVIYRGFPGTVVSATDHHERMAIWIPAQSLQHRLTAVLGEPAHDDLAFEPLIDWKTGPGQGIRRLFWLLAEELASPHSFARSDIACQSFTDLLIYSLLRSHTHNYSDRLARAPRPPVPRSIRRAEEYIRAHVGEPIALHDVANAGGCSVRSLQLGFRQFRDTTPTMAIRQTRLEAARQALLVGETTRTITDVAYQFGFANPGRFAGLYKATFGQSPTDDLRRHRRLRSD
jgi:AraC-like DNA-binding protein